MVFTDHMDVSMQPEQESARLLQRIDEAIKNAIQRLVGDDFMDDYSLEASFMDLGVESELIASFVGELNTEVRDLCTRMLKPDDFFAAPTPKALRDRILQEFRLQRSPNTALRGHQATDAHLDAVEVLGMDLHFPGSQSMHEDCIGPASFWELLQQGGDAIRDVPLERDWDNMDMGWRKREAAGAGPHKGGFLKDIALFTPAIFRISDAEASLMDPHQRFMLMSIHGSWVASGNPLSHPAESHVGVFVGHSNSQWGYFTPPSRGMSPYTGTGKSAAIIANRISYSLNLTGPSLTVDTACSSSLVAVDVACKYLRTGSCSHAVVGAADLMLHPESLTVREKAGMLAWDGRVKTFDAAADGYVRSEGCASVVLQRQQSAGVASDRALAVICSTAVNQDGRSARLTAPNGDAQQQLLSQLLQQSGQRGCAVHVAETHGTGTALGDPVEVQALRKVFCEGRLPSSALVLGAVKTNIGHLEGAAGLAGMVKIVLVLSHRCVPQNLHFESLNPEIDNEDELLLMPQESVVWPDRDVRTATVSSFGFGGTNASALLKSAERHVAPLEHPRSSSEQRDGTPSNSLSKRSFPWSITPSDISSPTSTSTREMAVESSGGDRQMRPELFATKFEVCASLGPSAAERSPRLLVLSGTDSPLPETLGRELEQRGCTLSSSPTQTLGGPWDGVIVVVGIHAQAGAPAANLHGSQLLLSVVEAWPTTALTVLDLTAGASDVFHPGYAGAVGFLRVLRSERGTCTKHIVVGRRASQDAARVAQLLLQEVSAVEASDWEPEVYYRDCHRRVPRLERLAPHHQPPKCLHDGIILITGGTSGLGLEAACVLAEQGWRFLVLAGKRSLKEVYDGKGGKQIEEKIQRMCRNGVRVELEQCDVRIECQLVHLLKRIRDEGTLVGVIHAAGVIEDAAIEHQTTSTFETVFGPKVFAAHALHHLTSQDPLQWFVLFSSTSGLLGTPGQLNYAAANSALDELARWRRDQGLCALSVQWCPVTGVGMFERLLARGGVHNSGSIHISQWRLIFGEIWAHEGPVVAVLPDSLIRTAPPGATIVRALHSQRVVRGEADGNDERGDLDVRAVRRKVDTTVRKALRDVGAAHESTGSSEFALDSLSSIEFARRLHSGLGVEVSAAALYNYPRVDAFVEHCTSLILSSPERLWRPVCKEAVPQSTSFPSLAIVAMTVCLPSSVRSLQRFWELLYTGEVVPNDVPMERWDVDAVEVDDEDVRQRMRYGYFLADADKFDAGFFSITPAEAVEMDPQQRVLLENCYEVLFASNGPPNAARTGLFVGISAWYQAATSHGKSPFAATNDSIAVASGRVARYLKLDGPCYSIDTACSSSLVALHSASLAIRNNDCDAALVSGVNMFTSSAGFRAAAEARMLSPTGSCHTFDECADGYARGEGCGSVVVQRMTDDGATESPALAVLLGTYTRHNAESANMVAPNGPAQEDLLRNALAVAHVGATAVDYIEAHGTGTVLGDEIEMGALAKVFTTGPVVMGAVKANVGHQEAGAGIIGLIKATLVLVHQIGPRNLRLHTLSPRIENVARENVFHFPDKYHGGVKLPCREAARDAARVAGVSSFGYSGTIAHAVLEKPRVIAPLTEAEPPYNRQVLPWTHGAFHYLQKVAQTPDGHDSSTAVTGRLLALLQHHVLAGCVVVPAASHLSQTLSALKNKVGRDMAVRLDDVKFVRPLSFERDADPYDLRLESVLKNGDQRLEIWSQWGDAPRTIHATGLWAVGEALDRMEAEGAAIMEDVRQRADVQCDVEAMYSELHKAGLELGPEFRTVREVWMCRDEAFAKLQTTNVDTAKGFYIHPAIIDGTFQAAAMALSGANGGVSAMVGKYPVSVGQVRYYAGEPIGHTAFAHIAVVESLAAETSRFHITIYNEQGHIVLLMRSVVLQKIALEKFRVTLPGLGYKQMLYRTQWVSKAHQPVDVPNVLSPSDMLLVSRSDSQIAQALTVIFPGAVSLRAADDSIGRYEGQFWEANLALAKSWREVFAKRPWRTVVIVYDASVTEGAPSCAHLDWISSLAGALQQPPHEGPAVGSVVVMHPTPSWHSDSSHAAEGGFGRPEAAGLFRVARNEAQNVTWLLVAVDGLALEQDAFPEMLAADLACAQSEREVLYCGCERKVPRLTAMDDVFTAPGTRAEKTVQQGTVIVTGGLGGLGLLAARELADDGRWSVVLVSRDPSRYENDEAVQADLREMKGVRIEKCDVSKEEDVEGLVQTLRARDPPLAGVVHAAGVLEDRLLASQCEETFRKVHDPKSRGAWLLHKHTQHDPIGLFVLFSSVAVLAGSVGQSNYAAANAYEDQLACWRVAHGYPAVSVQWPAVDGVGMAAASEGLQFSDFRKGIDAGLFTKIFKFILHENSAPLLSVIPPQYVPSLTRSGVIGSWSDAADVPGPPLTEAASHWSSIPAPDAKRMLEEILSSVLKRYDVLWALEDRDASLGLNSTESVAFVQELLEATGVVSLKTTLNATFLYNYPSVNAILKVLEDQVLCIADGGPHPSVTRALPFRIAVVGASLRLPHMHTMEGLWETLCTGGCSVTLVPMERWDMDAVPAISSDILQCVRYGAFLTDADLFDPGFFQISPREAQTMDPQQRLIVEVSYEALHGAGYAKETLGGSNTGVFVSIMGESLFPTYPNLRSSWDEGAGHMTAFSVSASSTAVASGRVSHALDLHGPSISLDTACSGSLVALHQARRSLQAHECDAAVVAAGKIMFCPQENIMRATAQMLSPTGRCHTFDQRADGYVPGEGIGAVVLKRLSGVDDDQPYCVIRGSAVQHDGRTATLTAPNSPAQVKLIQTALEDAGVQPMDVHFVEAHGTGTALGDPIEVQALRDVFHQRGEAPALVLGAVKANIGHTEACAGIMGLMKAILVLRHSKMPPVAGLEELNPNITSLFETEDDKQRLVFPREVVALETRGSLLVSGVSSFGFAGTITHAVLEQSAVRRDGVSAAVQMDRKSFPFTQPAFHYLQKVAQTPDGHDSSTAVTGRLLALLQHHVLAGCVVVPAASHLSQTLSALKNKVGRDMAVRLDDVKFVRPLSFERDADPYDLRLESVLKNGDQRLEIWSQWGDAPRTIHATGLWAVGEALDRMEAEGAAIMEDVRQRADVQCDVEAMYSELHKAGLELGPEFRTVREVWMCRDEAFAKLQTTNADTAKGFYIHPAIIDGTFQAAAMALSGTNGGVSAMVGKYPVSVGQVRYYAGEPIGHTAFAHIAVVESLAAETSRFHITIYNEQGHIVLLMRSVVLQKIALEKFRVTLPGLGYKQMLYRTQWVSKAHQPVDVPNVLSPSDMLLVSRSDSQIAQALTVIFPGAVSLRAADDSIGRYEGQFWEANLALAKSWREVFAKRPWRTVVIVYDASVTEGAPSCAHLDWISSLAGALQQPPHEGPAVGSVVVMHPTPSWHSDSSHAAEGGFGRPEAAGLFRVARNEAQNVTWLLVAVDGLALEQDAFPEMLAADLACAQSEREVLYCGCERKVPRLTAMDDVFTAPGTRAEKTVQQGTVIVTGGLGGLGLLAARELADDGRWSVVLVSRDPSRYENDEAVQADLREMKGVRIEKCDVSKEEDVEGLVQTLRARDPPLAGVVHAAGVLEDRLLASQCEETFRKVHDPKSRGAWLLHKHTQHDPIGLFVLFSSVAVLAGSVGQSNYAAANAYEDQLACWRVAHGYPAVSVQWPAVDGVGMAAASEGLQFSDFRKGIDAGLFTKIFKFILHENSAPLLSVIPPQYVPSLTHSGVIGSWSDAADVPGPPLTEAASHWSSIPAPDAKRMLEEILSSVLKRYDVLWALEDRDASLGLNSTESVAFVQELLEATGVVSLKTTLNATFLYNYPSVNAILKVLEDQVLCIADGGPHPSVTRALPFRIAVVGASLRLPHMHTMEGLWETLCTGGCSVTLVPMERWDMDAVPAISSDILQCVRYGAFLTDADLFDPGFFQISPREAQTMDPQQRLIVEVSYEALHGAGYAKETLGGSNTGVFVSIMGESLFPTYPNLRSSWDEGAGHMTAFSVSASSTAVASGRVSHALDLHGPSISLDTACSGSLVALHQARRSLQAHECDAAVVAAGKIMFCPQENIMRATAQMLSPTGRCHTFDQRADGYVPGEGIGAVVLKRLSGVDDDQPYCVIRGSAVQHDGRTATLTAPNSPAQVKLIQTALEDAGVQPMDVHFVEAHGTGTALGDPIEVQALRDVFHQRGEAPALVLGAVKANIGHTEACAGIMGLMKAILVLRHSKMPPVAGLEELNPNITSLFETEDDKQRLVFPREVVALETRGSLLVSGVSSFGFAGTITHAVLEQSAVRRDGVSAAVQMDRKSFPFTQPAFHYLQKVAQTPDGHDSSTAVTGRLLALLQHHVLAGCVVVPAASHLSQTLSALKNKVGRDMAVRLDDVKFVRPLSFERDADPYDLRLESVLKNGDQRLEIWSQWGDAPRTIHATGLWAVGEALDRMEAEGAAIMEDVRQRADVQCDVEAMYSELHKAGLELGPEFRTVREVWMCRDEAFAKLQTTNADTAKGFYIHPAIIDGTFQAAAMALSGTNGGVSAMVGKYPVSVGQVRYYAGEPIGHTAFAHIAVVESLAAETSRFHITIYNEQGHIVLLMRSVVLQKIALEKFRVTNRAPLLCVIPPQYVPSLTHSGVIGSWSDAADARSPPLTEAASHWSSIPAPDAKRMLEEILSSVLKRYDVLWALEDRDASLGLNSTESVAFVQELLEATGVVSLKTTLNATFLYNYPSVNAILKVLEDQVLCIADGGPHPSVTRHSNADDTQSSASSLAVIGVAFSAPGGSDLLGTFWDLLLPGNCAVSKVPLDRWNTDALDVDDRIKQCLSYAALLNDPEKFDRSYFGLTELEATNMDPQHRLLLEGCSGALHDAGRTKDSLKGSKTGVFIAILGGSLFEQAPGGTSVCTAFSVTSSSIALASGRVSHALDLHGPSISLDTACSGSLVALHQARRSLQAHECDAAVVAAGKIMFCPQENIMRATAQMLSPTGRCHTFDQRADGYVPGEGIGAVVLKRLSGVDDDQPYCVIRGSAVQHDGRTATLTAPNSPAQVKLIQTALEDAGVQPMDVHFVEAHGTGTALGDPIEVQALRDVFHQRGEAPALVLGAVKANIGHTEACAGIMGLMKAILVLRHSKMPPVAGLEKLNPNITSLFETEDDKQRLVFPREVVALETRGRPLRGIVNSFGFGGTIGTAVLQQPVAQSKAEAHRHQKPLRFPDRRSYPLQRRQPLTAAGESITCTKVPVSAACPLVRLPLSPVSSQTAAPRVGGAPPVAATDVFRCLHDALKATLAYVPEGHERDTPLSELGMDSLHVTEFFALLSRGLGAKISPTLISDHPSLARLEQYLLGHAPLDPTPALQLIRDDRVAFQRALAAQQRAMPPMLPRSPPASSPRHTSHVLLTGGTGFLGSHLLCALLRHTDWTLSCLVRADSVAHAQQRLKDAQTKFGLRGVGDVPWTDRVHAVCGDVSEAFFGIPREQYEALQGGTDIVVHAAAQVNYLLDYARLCRSNVIGTQNVIWFCMGTAAPPYQPPQPPTRCKLLYYVSSEAVLAADGVDSVTFRETEPLREEVLEGHVRNRFHYGSTKWVAEWCVQESGLECTIFRPSFVAGATTGAGHMPVEHLLPQLLMAILESGIGIGDHPSAHQQRVDFVPVDYFVECCLSVIREPSAYGKVYHVVNTMSPTLHAVSCLIQALFPGHRLKLVGLEQWIQHPQVHAYLEACRTSKNRHRKHFLSIFEVMSSLSSFPPMFSDSEMAQLMQARSAACLMVSEPLLGRYFDFLTREFESRFGYHPRQPEPPEEAPPVACVGGPGPWPPAPVSGRSEAPGSWGPQDQLPLDAPSCRPTRRRQHLPGSCDTEVHSDMWHCVGGSEQRGPESDSWAPRRELQRQLEREWRLDQQERQLERERRLDQRERQLELDQWERQGYREWHGGRRDGRLDLM